MFMFMLIMIKKVWLYPYSLVYQRRVVTTHLRIIFQPAKFYHQMTAAIFEIILLIYYPTLGQG